MQLFSNPNNITLEAKYVFPLDDGAGTCTCAGPVIYIEGITALLSISVLFLLAL